MGRRYSTEDLSHRPLVAPPFGRRLIRDPRAVGASGPPADGVAAAATEIAAAGSGDGRAAGLLVQSQDGAALTEWNEAVDQFLAGRQLAIASMRKRRSAADRCAPDAKHLRRRTRI